MATIRTLYVVTHSESQHHVDGVVGGWFDAALTDLGRRQAGAIATELRHRIPVEADAEVVSSDLARTRETAEGREQSWLDERYVFPPADGDRLDHDVGIAGAETRREVGERVCAAVDELLTHEATHLVVVTHGFAHTFVVGRWLALPLEAMGRATFAARSGCITELREDDLFGNRTLHRLAEVDHLGER